MGKLLFAAATAILLTACSGSQKDSDCNDSYETDTTVAGVATETVEVTIDSGSAYSQPGEESQERTFNIDGKKITVIYGQTTCLTILDQLGSPTLDMGEKLVYQWDTPDGMGHSAHFEFDDNNILIKAEERSAKI